MTNNHICFTGCRCGGKGISMNRICPECAVGKHGNCDGVADIDMYDKPIACRCDDAYHTKNGVNGG